MATIIGEGNVVNHLREALAADECGDITAVDVDHSIGGLATRCQGVVDALAAAQNGKPVILVGWMPEHLYAEKPVWHALMAYPNVRFLRLPSLAEELRAAVLDIKPEETCRDRLAVRLYEVGEINTGLGTIKHNLPHAQRQGEEALEKWAVEAQRIFGAEMSLEELIMATEDATPETLPARMAGEVFDDLCIDAEGTLIVDGTINPIVRALGEATEAKGLPVTIWTGGNIGAVRSVVRREGIRWKVTSKWLFRDVTVRAALDDESRENLRQKYGVEIKEFFQV